MTVAAFDRPTGALRADIAIRRAGNVALVLVDGDCAVDSARELGLAIDDALGAAQEGVIVDFGEGVDVVDSAVLGAIALASRHAEQLRQPLCLVADDDVRKSVERAGLDGAVSIVRNLGEAFATLRRQRVEERRLRGRAPRPQPRVGARRPRSLAI